MKMRNSFLCGVAVCWVLAGMMLGGCSEYQPGIAHIKAAVTSSYGSSVTIRVYIEGQDGNHVTGARVCAENPGGSLALAGFSMEAGCYAGSFSELLSGNYAITVYSSLLPEGKQELVIAHDIPNGKPVVSQLCDADGNNALLGRTLTGTTSVTVRWNAVSGASVYAVSVKNGVIQSWSGSTADTAVTIPASTLAQGSYTVSIKAQSLQGDPYLLEQDFYSASESQSSAVLFSVE